MKTSAFALAPLASCLVALVALGCKSADFADVPLGTTMVGTYSVEVTQEAAFGPNETTKYALKPTPGKPDKIECWYGAETSNAAKVTASYDAKDSDFDCLVATPATTMPGDKLWFTLTSGAMTANGSVTPSP